MSGEAQSERSCTRAEIENALPVGNPPDGQQPVKEAVREPRAVTLIVDDCATEIDFPTLVVPRCSASSYRYRLYRR
jgi:hypothetical protein